ncbi:hypothetical protein BT96DRAFT_242729 [Gymnopus androsaceus JB14]|uniref:Uncharacterized protein n=1 Tax=Gymnopus androsaceus JB14 TaxID=1447944 RepID=A0A6A4INA1_9AGAR|nr:hypothetical protein BT96DRAFT_242729 [Gymnopus androsaceus JB14]
MWPRRVRSYLKYPLFFILFYFILVSRSHCPSPIPWPTLHISPVPCSFSLVSKQRRLLHRCFHSTSFLIGILSLAFLGLSLAQYITRASFIVHILTFIFIVTLDRKQSSLPLQFPTSSYIIVWQQSTVVLHPIYICHGVFSSVLVLWPYRKLWHCGPGRSLRIPLLAGSLALMPDSWLFLELQSSDFNLGRSRTTACFGFALVTPSAILGSCACFTCKYLRFKSPICPFYTANVPSLFRPAISRESSLDNRYQMLSSSSN